MSLTNTLISVFRSTRDTEVQKGSIDTVGFYLRQIRDGAYRLVIEQVRAGDEEAKKNLPTFAFHGIFRNYRKAKDFIEATGLIILDIDDISPEDDLSEIKRDIMDSSDSVYAVMVSPSGNGLKILYYVDPEIVTADSYRQIGKQLVDNFSIYGHVDFLSITDCLIATYDPEILINDDAIPAFLYLKSVEGVTSKELEKLDESRVLWTDAEDFFDTVLAQDIEAKTNNNFHFIQVSILDLAKFGFRHPKDDLSFVVDYAETAFKSSSDNHKRFLEVVEIANQYPQTKWAYKTIYTDEDNEIEDEIDYSQYTTKQPKYKVESGSVEPDSEEIEINLEEGLIDYTNFYDRVLEVAREGDRIGYEISLKSFSDIFRFKGTGILTVTGIPGHGKTEFIDQCILDLARLYGHETIVAGFEQTPEEHLIKLMKKLIGANVTSPSYLTDNNLPTFKSAFSFVSSKIKHIDTTTVGGNISDILTIAAKTIKSSRDAGGNPRYVVIDPFNMLSVKGRFSGHEKIEEILRKITHFSHQMDVLVILVAHPFKMRKDEKTGKYEVPDFYSVKGSSAFFEMSYHGLVIYRTGYKPYDPVLARVLKVKQSNLGSPGKEVNFTYEVNSTRYIPIDAEGNDESGDHRAKDWLERALEVNK